MLDRVISVLLSGVGAAVSTVALFMLVWRWRYALALEIGWTRRGWLRTPALIGLQVLRRQEESPTLERVKLVVMLGVLMVTAPLLWLAFVDAIAGTSFITHGPGVAKRADHFALAAALCLFLVAAAWSKFAAVVRYREQLAAEIAGYIAEGQRILRRQTSDAWLPAVASSFAVAVAVGWAAVGLVGVAALALVVTSR
jgi:hypothetical protein